MNIMTKAKSKILMSSFFAGIILLALFKSVSAAWEEPTIGCSPPDCNRPAPLYSQSDAQSGPLNIKDITAGSGLGKIEANKICLCSGAGTETGSCTADKCITSWSSQGLWTKDPVTAKIYYNLANVGVGTDVASEKLEVFTNDRSMLSLKGNPDTNWVGTVLKDAGGNEKWFVGANGNKLLFRRNGATNDMVIDTNGNVGIGTGTTALNGRLEVFRSSNTDWPLIVSNNGGSAKGLKIKGGNTGNDGELLKVTRYDEASDYFVVTDGNSYFPNGNVGIGTANPLTKLDVRGAIVAVSGLNNGSTRPAVGNTRINGEIAGVGANGGLASDDGFLRLSAGGGTNANQKSFIDISGYSTVGDMSKNIVFGTGGAEAMRITGSGNVGIGTTAPGAPLDIQGTSGSVGDKIRFTSSTGNYNAIGNYNTNEMYIQPYTYARILRGYRYTSGNRKMTSDDTAVLISNVNIGLALDKGNVGIGTGTPVQKLEISANLATGDYARLRITDIDVGNNPELQLQYGSANDKEHWSIFSDKGNSNSLNIWSWNGADVNQGNRLTIMQNGNIGVGTSGPNEQLEITKNLRLPTTTGAAAGVILAGASRFIHNYGTENTFVGAGAGNFAMTGSQNTAIGNGSLAANTTGSSNTAEGDYTLPLNTTGYYNTAIGAYALNENTTGYRNTANGFSALYSNETGLRNTAFGNAALYRNTNGSGNTANGSSSLNNNATGSNNAAYGLSSLFSNTEGSYNVALGNSAGYKTTGSRNVFLGYNAGYNETGSGKLYVASSDTATPLIYGEFDNNKVKINGDLTVTGRVFMGLKTANITAAGGKFGGTYWLSVDCPTGTILLAGGCDQNQGQMMGSFPADVDTWTCHSQDSAIISATAICARVGD